jgi:hypothetical protein
MLVVRIFEVPFTAAVHAEVDLRAELLRATLACDLYDNMWFMRTKRIYYNVAIYVCVKSKVRIPERTFDPVLQLL